MKLLQNVGYLCTMGRKSKLEEDKKVKFGISLDPKLFNRMVKEKTNKSRLLEKLLREYYANKDM